MIINIFQSVLTKPFPTWLTTVVQYTSQHGLTIQPSRSVGTQQLSRRRPARQSLSTASWWYRSAPGALCLPRWSLPSSAASVHPPVVSSTHIREPLAFSHTHWFAFTENCTPWFEHVRWTLQSHVRPVQWWSRNQCSASPFLWLEPEQTAGCCQRWLP